MNKINTKDFYTFKAIDKIVFFGLLLIYRATQWFETKKFIAIEEIKKRERRVLIKRNREEKDIERQERLRE